MTPQRDRRYLIAAVALVVAIATLVLAFGIARAPALASLSSSDDNAPGSVAWTQWNNRNGCNELKVARPDGTVDSLTCQENMGDVIGWDAEGVVVTSWAPSGQVEETRDATTGELVSRTDVSELPPVADLGIGTSRVDGHLIVTLGGSTRVLWDVKASRGYEIRSGAKSPDGDWVAMVDSMNRLLLVPADGSAEPVVWATGVEATSWTWVVWKGTQP